MLCPFCFGKGKIPVRLPPPKGGTDWLVCSTCRGAKFIHCCEGHNALEVEEDGSSSSQVDSR